MANKNGWYIDFLDKESGGRTDKKDKLEISSKSIERAYALGMLPPDFSVRYMDFGNSFPGYALREISDYNGDVQWYDAQDDGKNIVAFSKKIEKVIGFIRPDLAGASGELDDKVREILKKYELLKANSKGKPRAAIGVQEELKPYLMASLKAERDGLVLSVTVNDKNSFSFIYPGDENCKVEITYDPSSGVAMTQDYQDNNPPQTDDISLGSFLGYLIPKSAIRPDQKQQLEKAGFNIAQLTKEQADLITEPTDGPENFYQDGELGFPEALTGKYLVELSSAGNIDFGQDPNKPLSPYRAAVISNPAQASKVVREYIEEFDLGGGNWTGGNVYNDKGEHIAHISYNGSAWEGYARNWNSETKKIGEKFIDVSVSEKKAQGGTLAKEFSISELKELLDKEFPDSFGFTLHNLKPGTREAEVSYDFSDGLNGIQDKNIRLSFPSIKEHGIAYHLYQGAENTYINFLLVSRNEGYKAYIGSFGFKDQGDVSSEYITRFMVFLFNQFGLPFQVRQEVFADGGSMTGRYEPEEVNGEWQIKDTDSKAIVASKFISAGLPKPPYATQSEAESVAFAMNQSLASEMQNWGEKGGKPKDIGSAETILLNALENIAVANGGDFNKSDAISMIEIAQKATEDARELQPTIINGSMYFVVKKIADYINELKKVTRNDADRFVKIASTFLTDFYREQQYATKSEQFKKFIEGLEKLTLKYGFVLHVTGGVRYRDGVGVKGIVYSNDLSSGDIIPAIVKWSDDETENNTRMEKGGQIKRSDFQLGETMRLINLAESGEPEKAIKELNDYITLYETEKKQGKIHARLGRSLDSIIEEYKNAVTYIQEIPKQHNCDNALSKMLSDLNSATDTFVSTKEKRGAENPYAQRLLGKINALRTYIKEINPTQDLSAYDFIDQF